MPVTASYARAAAMLPFAALAGALLSHLHVPLAWMIGPLLLLAIANGFGAGVRMPAPGRYAGQWLVGSALGLYFTAPVVAQLLDAVGWIALAVAASIAVSFMAGLVLARLGGADPVTAFFASAVGGAAEMAVHAERYGARVDQVAAAQAIRVLVVVLVVPFAFTLGGQHGSDVYAPVTLDLHLPGLLGLLALGGVAGLLLARLGVPNAWLLGPLAVGTLLTATGNALSSIPSPLVNAGQLLIGCALGARFTPAFFRESPRFLAGVAASSAILLAGCAAIGVAVAWLSGIAWPTAVLATAPGGLAEMSLTAKVLQLGVPMVTAFHTARLVVVVTTAGLLYRGFLAWRTRG